MKFLQTSLPLWQCQARWEPVTPMSHARRFAMRPAPAAPPAAGSRCALAGYPRWHPFRQGFLARRRRKSRPDSPPEFTQDSSSRSRPTLNSDFPRKGQPPPSRPELAAGAPSVGAGRRAGHASTQGQCPRTRRAGGRAGCMSTRPAPVRQLKRERHTPSNASMGTSCLHWSKPIRQIESLWTAILES
jgi:hypothetical protein